MAFQRFESFSELKAAGIEYGLTFGRRQPMHIKHKEIIDEIFANGLKPIIVVGSINMPFKANGIIDPLFEPIANPLTYEQQVEQIKLSFPDKELGRDYFICGVADIGDNQKWYQRLVDTISGELEVNGRFPDLFGKTALIFTGKVEDKKPRRLVTGEGEGKDVLSYTWEGIIEQLGLPIFEQQAREPLSSTSLRQKSLNSLTADEKSLFTAPDYIKNLANTARQTNGLGSKLSVTTFDLTVERLKEKGISGDAISSKAWEINPFPQLEDYVEAARQLNSSIIKQKTKRLKIASASLNQTVYDYANNVANIEEAIDKAIADGADILSLPELSLTGYSADDYHQWNKNNESVWRQLQYIAEYAAAKDPNLIISVGTPWHYADKELRASEQLYNINNRPYNAQVTLTGGKVVAMAAKSILADGPAEYEPRQFRAWPNDKGTIEIKLPDGSKIPFGKPIIAFEKDGERFTLFHEQCAEGWPGVNDDLTIVDREQNQARLIAELSKATDLSVVINPSASRPQPGINKEKIRMQGLCETGSKYCGAFVYTNYLGSESGIYAAEGSKIWAQDGKIIHHGERYSFGNVSYASTTVDVPLAKKGQAHLTVQRDYKSHEIGTVGAEADFEMAEGDELKYEEYARSTALELRDYLAKQSWQSQGYLISLSGGADSAYGAVAVASMIEMDVKQEGMDGFFKRFPHLKCKDEALNVLKKNGEHAVINFIKREMLTCVYLPGDNSGTITLNAAQKLAEEIGAKFVVCSVQGAIDEYIIAASGLNIQQAVIDAENDKSRSLKSQLFGKVLKFISNNSETTNGLYEAWTEKQIRREVKKYANAKLGSKPHLPEYIAKNCTSPVLTWAETQHDLNLQSLQARSRVAPPWMIATLESKIPLVTSNASEAALGYSTAAGDSHMGGLNPIGGIPKSTLKKSLQYFEKKGLIGLSPIAALRYINNQEPTAELRPEVEGQAKQTDAIDLGFDYNQSEKMERVGITGRHTPLETYKTLLGDNSFPSDPIEMRQMLVKFHTKWGANQFKRVMAVLAPYMGDNFDPHASVRTTVLGDHFRTPIALLTIYILAQKHGGEDKLADAIGVPVEEIRGIVERSKGLKEQLNKVDCSVLNLNQRDLAESYFAKEIRRDYQRIQQMNQRVA